MDRTTLTRNLSVLEKKGFLKTGKSSLDPRITNVTISSKGLKQIETSMTGWHAFQNEAIERVGKDKWHQMICVLKEIADMDSKK